MGSDGAGGVAAWLVERAALSNRVAITGRLQLQFGRA